MPDNLLLHVQQKVAVTIHVLEILDREAERRRNAEAQAVCAELCPAWDRGW
jgi:hypothetical protein